MTFLSSRPDDWEGLKTTFDKKRRGKNKPGYNLSVLKATPTSIKYHSKARNSAPGQKLKKINLKMNQGGKRRKKHSSFFLQPNCDKSSSRKGSSRKFFMNFRGRDMVDKIVNEKVEITSKSLMSKIL